MKILIVTVAGMSSRFSESIGQDTLKCIYTEGGVSDTLLYKIVHLWKGFDKIVIVGGFHYDELVEFVKEQLKDLKGKIVLVKNEHYSDYGSGYSLKLGLLAAMKYDFSEIVFAEGDLFLDEETFVSICEERNNVITCNKEAIMASKAVAFYYDEQYHLHYIYDTNHSSLVIQQPFLGIFNSGQVWKFVNAQRIRCCVEQISDETWQGTNLVMIQSYFGTLEKDAYEMYTFSDWINCNTVEDYRKSLV